MIVGLSLFRDRFADYADRYVLIGGASASLAMEEADLEFRSTKDLDVVLTVETADAEFGKAFWDFVEDGGTNIARKAQARRYSTGSSVQ